MTISTADMFSAKILIVDDLLADVLLLQRMLAGAGYTRVSATTNPHEVCELHRAQHYDLILLDLSMPGMDGFAVMAGLKDIETSGYLPVLVLTVDPDQKLRALQAGAKDFISKPFDVAEVLLRVHNLLEVRLLHKRARHNSKLMESLALSDPLTGLANRRMLDDRVWAAMAHARRHSTAMAVVYLDLDGFKQINDSLGHGVGDSLLKMVAERLLDTVREQDTVARQGGDEFMIVLWEVGSASAAITVVSKIIAAVSQPYDIDGQTVSITTSAGLSLYPAHGEDVETLIKSADFALYEAKRAGKNVYRLGKRQGSSGPGPSPEPDPRANAPIASTGKTASAKQ